MNALDRARLEFFAAMLMEYHRSEGILSDYESLSETYNVRAPKDFFDPTISEHEPWFIVSRTLDGLSARIRPSGYPGVYREVTDAIDASEFRIDWNKQEIVADVGPVGWFPVPDGWKWFRLGDAQDERIRAENHADTAINSSRWTGLPSAFQLSEDKRQALVRDLEMAEEALTALAVGQEVRAQARAYIIAAKTLAEAPDPPADVIWEIIARGNALSGIASLFVSIIALFAH